MKILVTGGAGFIGSTVVDEFISLGHQVWVVDNETSGNKKNINAKARYQKCDVRDAAGLRKIFKKVRFDVVDHHAAQIDVRKSVADPVYDANVNIIGLLNVLELCKEFKTKKIIFSSSGGTVYGECLRPAKETDPEQPLSPYGVAKLASEKYIKAYHSLFGLNFTIFRYSNVYGPRQDPHGEAGVVLLFSKKFLRGDCPFVFGSGRQTRDFVYVKDVAAANGLALKRGNNQVINIGDQKETSVLELYKAMAHIVGFKKNPIFKPARKGELQRSVLNNEKAKKILSWSPKVSLKQGLTESIRYFETSEGFLDS